MVPLNSTKENITISCITMNFLYRKIMNNGTTTFHKRKYQNFMYHNEFSLQENNEQWYHYIPEKKISQFHVPQ